MPHRDALVAARERITALERELADARSSNGSTTSELVERLTDEKRALQAERARLVIERDRLIDDLARAKTALAKAEASSAAVRRELEQAKTIRDQLRRQAVDGAAKAGEGKRGRKGSERAARGPTPTPTLEAHNLAQPALEGTEASRAGVLCPACHARRESVEMHASSVSMVIGGREVASVICPRCGHMGGKIAE